jgi:hypothetical protein
MPCEHRRSYNGIFIRANPCPSVVEFSPLPFPESRAGLRIFYDERDGGFLAAIDRDVD